MMLVVLQQRALIVPTPILARLHDRRALLYLLGESRGDHDKICLTHHGWLAGMIDTQ